MICPQSELSTQQVWQVLLDEGNYCEKLSSGHAILTLWLCQQSAAIGHHPFLTLTVTLRENSPNPHIASIRVQNEGFFEVGECEDRG